MEGEKDRLLFEELDNKEQTISHLREENSRLKRQIEQHHDSNSSNKRQKEFNSLFDENDINNDNDIDLQAERFYQLLDKAKSITNQVRSDDRTTIQGLQLFPNLCGTDNNLNTV